MQKRGEQLIQSDLSYRVNAFHLALTYSIATYLPL
jgi:hypothetical protein